MNQSFFSLTKINDNLVQLRSEIGDLAIRRKLPEQLPLNAVRQILVPLVSRATSKYLPLYVNAAIDTVKIKSYSHHGLGDSLASALMQAIGMLYPDDEIETVASDEIAAMQVSGLSFNPYPKYLLDEIIRSANTPRYGLTDGLTFHTQINADGKKRHQFSLTITPNLRLQSGAPLIFTPEARVTGVAAEVELMGQKVSCDFIFDNSCDHFHLVDAVVLKTEVEQAINRHMPREMAEMMFRNLMIQITPGSGDDEVTQLQQACRSVRNNAFGFLSAQNQNHVRSYRPNPDFEGPAGDMPPVYRHLSPQRPF